MAKVGKIYHPAKLSKPRVLKMLVRFDWRRGYTQDSRMYNLRQGFPSGDCALTAGADHDVDSSGVAFEIAGRQAARKGLADAERMHRLATGWLSDARKSAKNKQQGAEAGKASAAAEALLAVCFGLPVLFLLGAGVFIWGAASILLVFVLVTRGRILIPKGTVPLLLFMAWVALSVLRASGWAGVKSG